MTLPKPGTIERREYEKLQKRKTRAATRAARSPQDFRAQLEKVWQANRDLLTPAEREALRDRILDFQIVNGVLDETIRFLRLGKCDKAIFPDINFESIESFAREFPSTSELEFHHLVDYDPDKITEIESAPYYFREYGLPIDSIDHRQYWDFIHLFGEWYRKNKSSLDDPEIIALIKQNERLTPTISQGNFKVPRWQAEGFESYKLYQNHLADLARTEKMLAIQREADKLSAMTQEERQKLEAIRLAKVAQ